MTQQQCIATLLFGKMHFPLLCAAAQNRSTAGLCQRKHTYGGVISKCAVSQQQCTATLFWQKAYPLLRGPHTDVQ